MMDDGEIQITSEKEHNNRVPSFIKKSKIGDKLFANGWKFDLFNTQGQVVK
jgi:hypothetical protein